MMKVRARLVSAKDIAKLGDISYAAINNYTDMGLLTVVAKKNRVRLYDLEAAKERLTLIAKFLAEGYPLRMIAKLLE